ncbi:class I SAM-dependent methyltransferase [Govanella unica]|uniref:Class I SAM-dependent methyltransferase n=1 Tax=Govanella unica TaxID=2975056 RepID=A0A9X3TZ05_9PROT|nr:class I SAM-dependent methyltransferase [Govania unica]MDA5194243.1 class I SAM-dependent methyltransferase [Govania unica]
MTLPLDDQAALDFALHLRRGWAARIYPQVKREFDDEASGSADLAAQIHALPTYPWFSWMERSSQKMLWRAVVRAVRNSPRSSRGNGAEVNAALELPSWYTDWDIHLQPGGVWSRDDAAAIYELGAKLVMMGDNDDYKFHQLFVDTAVPKKSYGTIVDLGCGFGKSTWPFAASFPDAKVIGVDLSAPCVELAAERAAEKRLAIRFIQADATATPLDDASADLVTSTMFVHEIPLAVLPTVFSEAARLLAPGGILRFLDFHVTGDAFRDFAMIEHGTRNNEPFMPDMLRNDLTAMAEAAGLRNARWVAFDERGDGRRPDLSWPERPEWHFPWAVLEAEKPA